jgi:hypothetical protein
MHEIVCRASPSVDRLALFAVADDISELTIAEDDNAASRAGVRRPGPAYRRDGLKLARKTPRAFEAWAEANLKR